jgi:TP901-1 family phage major tail protein
MTAQCGSAIVLSIKDAEGTLQAIAGLRNKRFTLNSETVDVTNSDSVGRWRELLDGCGVRSFTFAGDGVFLDDDGAAVCVDMMMNNSIRDATLLIPGLGTFEANIKLSQCEFSGAYNGETTYSITGESAGAAVFTGA